MPDAPEKIFHWPVRVYYEDTDTGGIVFYANYLKFFERARTEWLRAANVSQHELSLSEQIMFVVKNTNVEYHAAAKLDDELFISVKLQKLGRASVNFLQHAWLIGGDTPKLLCTGSIRVGCVDIQSLRPTAIPETTMAKIRVDYNFLEKK